MRGSFVAGRRVGLSVFGPALVGVFTAVAAEDARDHDRLRWQRNASRKGEK